MSLASWEQTSLGQFVSLQRGHDLPSDRRRDGTVPVLGSFGITGWHDTAKAKAPGVTIGRSGASFGVVSFSEVDYWPLNTALYVTDFHGNDEQFAYYFLKSINFKRYNSGSAQPSLNRNYIYPIPITVPPIEEQKQIASLLGTIDRKIELNRRMNETLEALARAIFKSWFVDFDPVHAKARGEQPVGMDAATAALFPDSFVDGGEFGRIPTGWQRRPLDKIAHFQNGLALQKYPPEDNDFLPVIKIRELRQGSPDDRSAMASPNIKASCILHDGDVVFSWSGSLLVDIWCGGRGALNQHLFKVTSKNYPKWFYYLWTHHHLGEFQRIAAGKATTMGHIKRHHLSDALVNVPPKQLLLRASKIISPLIQQIINNRLESRTLAALRDTLLPELMIGRVRLPTTS